jgi:uncharacterized protein YbaP (TraB family)
VLPPRRLQGDADLVSGIRRTALGLLAALTLSVAALAAEPPACGGRSLVDELQRLTPDRLQAAFTRAAVVKNAEGLLWRIEKPGLAPSHLFGTAHVTDPRAVALPALVRKAAASADAVAVELTDVFVPERAALFAGMLLSAAFVRSGGDTLAFITEPALRQTLEAMTGEVGLTGQAAGRLQPWFLALVLSMPRCEQARQAAHLPAVDKVVLDARRPGVQPVALETVDEQLAAFRTIDRAVAERALLFNARHPDRRDDVFATLVDLYLRRWPSAMLEIMEASGVADAQDSEDLVAVENSLRQTRDPRLAQRALPLLARGNALIAVGALHLAGDDGLVERFRRAGYTVTRVW